MDEVACLALILLYAEYIGAESLSFLAELFSLYPEFSCYPLSFSYLI
jgi:hypothetical protein